MTSSAQLNFWLREARRLANWNPDPDQGVPASLFGDHAHGDSSVMPVLLGSFPSKAQARNWGRQLLKQGSTVSYYTLEVVHDELTLEKLT